MFSLQKPAPEWNPAVLLFNVNVQQTPTVSLSWQHGMLWNLPVSILHINISLQINIGVVAGDYKIEIWKKNKKFKLFVLISFFFTSCSWHCPQCFWQEFDCSVTPFILVVKCSTASNQLGLRLYLSQRKYGGKRFHFSLNVMKVVVSFKEIK